MAVGAGLEDHAARALVNLAAIPVAMRDYRHARRDLDRALAFAQAHDLTGYAQHLLGQPRPPAARPRGLGRRGAGRAGAALAERMPTGGPRAVDALTTLGLLQARRGDPEAAATLQEATEQALATSELQWPVPVAAARAEYAWLTGMTTGPPRRPPACSSWPCGRVTPGSPGSWPAGCGWPAHRRRRGRWRWPSRTGWCWLVNSGGGRRRRLGGARLPLPAGPGAGLR